MDQNQLNNLYYNIGWGDTNGIGYDGGGRVNFTDMGVSGLSKVRLSSDQLINRGKTLADKNQGARYAGQVKDYRNALTKAKADKASGNNPNYNWDEYIKSLNKNLSTYSKMASGYNKYLSGMDRLNAGETIERQGPQEGYTFDMYRGWVAPPKAALTPEEIKAQDKQAYDSWAKQQKVPVDARSLFNRPYQMEQPKYIPYQPKQTQRVIQSNQDTGGSIAPVSRIDSIVESFESNADNGYNKSEGFGIA